MCCNQVGAKTLRKEIKPHIFYNPRNGGVGVCTEMDMVWNRLAEGDNEGGKSLVHRLHGHRWRQHEISICGSEGRSNDRRRGTP